MRERLHYQLLEQGMFIAKKVFLIYSNKKIITITPSSISHCFGLDLKKNEEGDLYILNQPVSEGELLKKPPRYIESLLEFTPFTIGYTKNDQLIPTKLIKENLQNGLLQNHKNLYIDRTQTLNGITVEEIIENNPEHDYEKSYFYKLTSKGHRRFEILGKSPKQQYKGGHKSESDLLESLCQPNW